jgi:hypothetical protein
MAKHVHMSLIVTYKLYHHCIRGYINNVIRSIFIDTPRYILGERKRITHQHILVLHEDVPGQEPGCSRTHLGALEHI